MVPTEPAECVKSNEVDNDDSFASEIVRPPSANGRDEIQEAKKISTRDTVRVKRWRLLVMVGLIGTAAVMSAATFRLLSNEQEARFEEAVS